MKSYENFTRDDVEFVRSVFVALIQSGQIQVTEMDLTHDSPQDCQEKMSLVLRQVFPLLGNALRDLDDEISEVRNHMTNDVKPNA